MTLPSQLNKKPAEASEAKGWRAGLCLTRVIYYSIILLFLSIASADIALAADEPKDAACTKDFTATTTTPGKDIVTAVFTNINTLLGTIGTTMYTTIASSDNFKHIAIAVVVMYIAIYGMMIMLGLISHSPGEVLTRLVKVAIFFTLINPTPIVGASSSYLYFDQYVARFFMGGMNELIYDFTTVAWKVSGNTTSSLSLSSMIPTTGYTSNLSIDAVSSFFPAMDMLFQPYFIISVLGMIFLGTTGFMMAGIMCWATVDLIFLIVGAIVTYVKSVIGLTFLFGVAPIFIVFMFFQQTKHITSGWINQLVYFMITPVLVFAFLAFYDVFLNYVLQSMFKGINFCYSHFISVPGTPIDIGWWRPAQFDKDCNCWKLIPGDWINTDGSERPPVISPVSIIYFLVISHLGKHFSTHIAEISQDLSEGIGSSVVTGAEVSGWMKGLFTNGFKSLRAPAKADSTVKKQSNAQTGIRT